VINLPVVHVGHLELLKLLLIVSVLKPMVPRNLTCQLKISLHAVIRVVWAVTVVIHLLHGLGSLKPVS